MNFEATNLKMKNEIHDTVVSSFLRYWRSKKKKKKKKKQITLTTT